MIRNDAKIFSHSKTHQSDRCLKEMVDIDNVILKSTEVFILLIWIKL